MQWDGYFCQGRAGVDISIGLLESAPFALSVLVWAFYVTQTIELDLKVAMLLLAKHGASANV